MTTASDLAKRVGGSLTDAKHLAGSLGRALEIVGLLGAVLIAVLLTLASVAKRVRELGTLKAIGWTRWQVTRQVGGEALAQGLFGGVLGILLGLVGIAVVNAVGWTLKASVPAASTGFPSARERPRRRLRWWRRRAVRIRPVGNHQRLDPGQGDRQREHGADRGRDLPGGGRRPGRGRGRGPAGRPAAPRGGTTDHRVAEDR